MLHLSEQERISLLMMRGWGDRLRSYTDVKNLFNYTFRNADNGISRSTVHRTIRRFEQTGSAKNRPKPGRPISGTSPETSLDVLLSVIENPHDSSRRVALQHDISQGSVLKILKANKFHPFKVHL